MHRMVGLGVAGFAIAAIAAEGAIEGWQPVEFVGQTHYQRLETSSGWQVQAISNASASGLSNKHKIALNQTPILRWMWRVEQPIDHPADEKSKEGDDFVARVYVIKEGFFPWQSYAINYVWSRQYPVGAHWPNPYTDHAMMVVVDSCFNKSEQWQSHARDIKADFKQYFNMDIDQVDAVAIMTDTDNTGSRAEAVYRDIGFGK